MLEKLENVDLSHILKSCPVGIALTDEKRNITWVNDAFENYLGITAEEINNLNLDELPENLKALFDSSSTVHMPANAVRKEQWFMCQQTTLTSKQHIIHYITDVTPLHILMKESELLQGQLESALAIDQTTGMPNKEALLQNLESQVSRSRRYNNQLSIVIMRINDINQFDEATADALLLSISQMLNDQVRWADMVGRLSHDAFLLILPETSGDACKSLTDNLRERLKNIDLKPLKIKDDYFIDARFGYAEWQKGQDISLLMQTALQMIDTQ